MIAILTKYIGPTDTRGARIKAYCANGQQITISFPYEDNETERHARAALALCAKMKWKGDLIGGGTKDGYAFVFADDTRIKNPVNE